MIMLYNYQLSHAIQTMYDEFNPGKVKAADYHLQAVILALILSVITIPLKDIGRSVNPVFILALRLLWHYDGLPLSVSLRLCGNHSPNLLHLQSDEDSWHSHAWQDHSQASERRYALPHYERGYVYNRVVLVCAGLTLRLLKQRLQLNHPVK